MKLPPRLKKQEVEQVFQRGKSKAYMHTRFVWTEGNSQMKVSYLSPTKLGNAVKRNHIRRIMRESFFHLSPKIPSDIHLVILARKSILGSCVEELMQILKVLIGKCF